MRRLKNTLIPSLEEDNLCNSIFSGLLGVELQPHVPHAIELIQGIRSIASHDWRHLDQIPSTTDLSSLPGMFHLLPHHQELLDLHHDCKYSVPISAGGGGGGGDKGDNNGDDDYDDEEEDGADPYDTDKTVDDVSPPSDQVEKWEQALLNKRTQRMASKRWDVIRILFDGLLDCYEKSVVTSVSIT